MIETCMTGGASDQIIVDVTPAGCRFHHTARKHRKDVGILFRDSLKFRNCFRFQPRFFENYQLTFTISVHVIINNSFHSSKKNGLKTAGFSKDYPCHQQWSSVDPGWLQHPVTKNLSDILRSASLTEHVQERTHKHGHILDLVITWDVGNLVKGVSVSTMLSDHFLIDILVSLEKPSLSAKAVSYSKLYK